jgi:hypothetical protein
LTLFLCHIIPFHFVQRREKSLTVSPIADSFDVVGDPHLKSLLLLGERNVSVRIRQEALWILVPGEERSHWRKSQMWPVIMIAFQKRFDLLGQRRQLLGMVLAPA